MLAVKQKLKMIPNKVYMPWCFSLLSMYLQATDWGQPADAGLLLEESPKWHLLTMVLEEIHKESRKNTASEYDSEMNDYIQWVYSHDYILMTIYSWVG